MTGVTPGNVLVNVYNASGTDGLAGETMDALGAQGVRRGHHEQHRRRRPADSGAVIWTNDPDGPAAKLLQTYLGKDAEVIDQATADLGITVVVGEGFPGIKDGKTGVKAKDDSYVCSPPDQVAP